MALIKCKDCKKEFSTDAKRCPHCGAKKRGGISAMWSIIIIIGFIYLMVKSHGDNYLNELKLSPVNPADYVLSACRNFITDSLHDPSSAEFDSVYPKPIIIASNEYKMTLPLRAKNGFGALRHFAIECVVRFKGDSWSLVELNEIK